MLTQIRKANAAYEQFMKNKKQIDSSNPPEVLLAQAVACLNEITAQENYIRNDSKAFRKKTDSDKKANTKLAERLSENARKEKVQLDSNDNESEVTLEQALKDLSERKQEIERFIEDMNLLQETIRRADGIFKVEESAKSEVLKWSPETISRRINELPILSKYISGNVRHANLEKYQALLEVILQEKINKAQNFAELMTYQTNIKEDNYNQFKLKAESLFKDFINKIDTSENDPLNTIKNIKELEEKMKQLEGAIKEISLELKKEYVAKINELKESALQLGVSKITDMTKKLDSTETLADKIDIYKEIKAFASKMKGSFPDFSSEQQQGFSAIDNQVTEKAELIKLQLQESIDKLSKMEPIAFLTAVNELRINIQQWSEITQDNALKSKFDNTIAEIKKTINQNTDKEKVKQEALKEFDRISGNKEMTVLEKATALDNLLAQYFIFFGEIPQEIKEKYQVVSQQVNAEISKKLGEQSEHLFNQLNPYEYYPPKILIQYVERLLTSNEPLPESLITTYLKDEATVKKLCIKIAEILSIKPLDENVDYKTALDYFKVNIKSITEKYKSSSDNKFTENCEALFKKLSEEIGEKRKEGTPTMKALQAFFNKVGSEQLSHCILSSRNYYQATLAKERLIIIAADCLKSGDQLSFVAIMSCLGSTSLDKAKISISTSSQTLQEKLKVIASLDRDIHMLRSAIAMQQEKEPESLLVPYTFIFTKDIINAGEISPQSEEVITDVIDTLKRSQTTTNAQGEEKINKFLIDLNNNAITEKQLDKFAEEIAVTSTENTNKKLALEQNLAHVLNEISKYITSLEDYISPNSFVVKRSDFIAALLEKGEEFVQWRSQYKDDKFTKLVTDLNNALTSDTRAELISACKNNSLVEFLKANKGIKEILLKDTSVISNAIFNMNDFRGKPKDKKIESPQPQAAAKPQPAAQPQAKDYKEFTPEQWKSYWEKFNAIIGEDFDFENAMPDARNKIIRAHQDALASLSTENGSENIQFISDARIIGIQEKVKNGSSYQDEFSKLSKEKFNVYDDKNWENYWKIFNDEVKGNKNDTEKRLAAHGVARDRVGFVELKNDWLVGQDNAANINSADYEKIFINGVRSSAPSRLGSSKIEQILMEMEGNGNKGQWIRDYTDKKSITEMRKKFDEYKTELQKSGQYEQHKDLISRFEACWDKVIKIAETISTHQEKDQVKFAGFILELLQKDENLEAINEFQLLSAPIWNLAKDPSVIKNPIPSLRGLTLIDLISPPFQWVLKYESFFRSLAKEGQSSEQVELAVSIANRATASVVGQEDKVNNVKKLAEDIKLLKSGRTGDVRRAIGTKTEGVSSTQLNEKFERLEKDIEKYVSTFGHITDTDRIAASRNINELLPMIIEKCKTNLDDEENLIILLNNAKAAIAFKQALVVNTSRLPRSVIRIEEFLSEIKKLNIKGQGVEAAEAELRATADKLVVALQQKADQIIDNPASSSQQKLLIAEKVKLGKYDQAGALYQTTPSAFGEDNLPIAFADPDEENYERIQAKQGGANAAGNHGGIYQHHASRKKVLFKQDPIYAKNIAEFIAGRASKKMLGEASATIILGTTNGTTNENSNGDEVYVGSVFFDNYKEDFYKYAYENYGKANEPIPTDRPKLAGFAENGPIQQALTKASDDHKKSFAKIAAASLLLGNFDIHAGNIGITEDGKLVTFDFGAAFQGLEREIHPHSHSRHLPGFGPTNHFRDYPRSLRISEEMAQAIDEITQKQDLSKVYETAIDDMAKFYGYEPIKAFAQRLGVDVEQYSDKASLVKGTKGYLTNLMKARQQSLKQFGLEIKIDLMLDKKVTVDDIINYPELVKNEEKIKEKKLCDEIIELIKKDEFYHDYFLQRSFDKKFHFRGENHRGGFIDRHITGETHDKYAAMMEKAINAAFEEIRKDNEKPEKISKELGSADAKEASVTTLEKLKPADAKEVFELQLSSVIAIARQKAANMDFDENGVEKIILKRPEDGDLPYGTNGQIEVKLFRDDQAYNRVNINDIRDRVEFLANVANSMLAGHDNVAINTIRNDYLEKLDTFKELLSKESIRKIEAENSEKAFAEIDQQVKIYLRDMQQALLQAVSGKETLDPKTTAELEEDFNTASINYLIQTGRSNIVNVSQDGFITAHFTKGERTYPSNHRDSQDDGVNPNSVFEVTAQENSGKITVSGIISRAASYSVLGIVDDEQKLQRITLNYKNAKADAINIVEGFIGGIKDPDPSKVYEIDMFSSSLLTPWLGKLGEGIVSRLLKSYKPETRQLKDHHRALEMLNGEIIEVNGVKVKLNIIHQNYPVNTNGKHWEMKLSELQNHVNARGFGKYVQQQMKSLGNSGIDLPYVLIQPTDIKLIDEIKNKEQQLTAAYNRLRQLAEIKGISVEEFRTAEKEVLSLEKDLSKLYTKAYEHAADYFKNNSEKLQGVMDKLCQKVMNTKDPKEIEKLQQALYFLDVQKQYYSGDYKKRENIYAFVARMNRSAELAGAVPMGNCKSSKDRTGWLCDYRNVLIAAENDSGRRKQPLLSAYSDDNIYLENRLSKIHEYGASLEATGKNSPGARGNRQNRYGDKTGIDKLASGWQKLKSSKNDPLKTMIKSLPKISTIDEYLDLLQYLDIVAKSYPASDKNIFALRNEIHDRLFKYTIKPGKSDLAKVLLGSGSEKDVDNVLQLLQKSMGTNNEGLAAALKPYRSLMQFAGIENKIFKTAIVNMLFEKIASGITLPNDALSQDSIKRINSVFETNPKSVKEFTDKYQAFLKTVIDAKPPLLNNLQAAFNAALVLQQGENHSAKIDEDSIKELEKLQQTDSEALVRLNDRVNALTEKLEDNNKMIAAYYALVESAIEFTNSKVSEEDAKKLNSIADQLKADLQKLDENITKLSSTKVQIDEKLKRSQQGQTKQVTKEPATLAFDIKPSDPSKPFVIKPQTFVETSFKHSGSGFIPALNNNSIPENKLYFTVAQEGIRGYIPEARKNDAEAKGKMIRAIVDQAIKQYGATKLEDLNFAAADPAIAESAKKYAAEKFLDNLSLPAASYTPTTPAA